MSNVRTGIVAYCTTVALFGATVVSCAANRPASVGVVDSTLRPCPVSPNCVSSDETNGPHWVAPIEFLIPPDEGWVVAVEVVSRLPRTKIIVRTDLYLHAEVRSATMGFVDDLELSLREARYEIAIRSSSRVGYSDGGVNRRRVETVRDELAERGVGR